MTAKYEGDAIPWKVSLSTGDVHNLKQGYKCGGGKRVIHLLLKVHCMYLVLR